MVWRILLEFCDVLMDAKLGVLNDSDSNIMELLCLAILKAILLSHPQTASRHDM